MMNEKYNSIKNNKGVSIVEILVVVAIIAVLLSASVLSLSYINMTSRKQAANNVLSYVGNAQTAAETRVGSGEYVNYGFAIYSTGDGTTKCSIVLVKADGSDYKIASDEYVMTKYVPVTVNTSGAAYNMNSSAHKIVVTFDRTSGVCQTLYVDGAATTDVVNNIAFGNNDKKVNFVWSTGKFALD